MKGIVGEDVLTGFILVFIIAIVSVAAWFAFSQISSVPGLSSAQGDIAMGYVGTAISMFDGIIALAVAGIGIGAIVSGIVVRSHPIVFVVMILLNGATALMSLYFTNVFVTMQSTGLAASVAHFTTAGMVIQYFPAISLAMSFIAAIVVFSQRGGSNP